MITESILGLDHIEFEKLNEIKKLIAEGKRNIEIEKITGIPSCTISRIRHNKLYKEKEREVN